MLQPFSGRSDFFSHVISEIKEKVIRGAIQNACLFQYFITANWIISNHPHILFTPCMLYGNIAQWNFRKNTISENKL